MSVSKFIPRFICIILIVSVLCTIGITALRRTEQTFVVPDASALEITSNRHAHPESDKTVANTLSTDGYELKMQNDNLELWYRKEVKGIRVVDKRSGYIWGSVAGDEVEGLNKKWTQTAHSLCTVEYLDSKYNVTKVCMSDSSINVKENWKSNTATFKLDLKRQDITLEFTLKLNEDSITISLDDKDIVEEDEYLLKDVYFLPFFGCTYEDATDGYIFIPDGSGALMRFAKSSKYIAGYSQKVYGLDMGIDQLSDVSDLVSTRTNDYLVESGQITVPVYGVVHGADQNAIMTVIENGEEFSHIEATPAGVTTPYNWVMTCFNYRQMYTHIVGKTGGGVYRPQKQRNTINPSITISFLTGDDADYVGMAKKYREKLIKNGDIKTERKDSDIPLALNVIGAEIAEGEIFNYTKEFTTVKEAQKMLKNLSKDGIKNITMMLEGWQSGGINGSDYAETDIESAVGDEDELLSLKKELSKNGGRIYLNSNVVTANEGQISLNSYASLQISKQYSVFSRSNTSVMFNKYYVIKPSKLFEAVLGFDSELSDFNFNFGQLGYRMYADYTTDEEITRTQFREKLLKTMSKLGGKTAFSNPNAYLYKYTSDYFDMPMCNSQYLYETDTVPFLQIVLKGSVDYYAPYSNQSGYSKTDVLKMIEFGAYPSFIVASSDNYSLQGTPLEDYFSISFEDWYPTVTDIYGSVNKALSKVEGARIMNHTVLADGIVKVDYENGVSIFVNYTAKDYTFEEITVKAFDFAVVSGGMAQ